MSPQSPDSPGLRVLIVEADADVREDIRGVVDHHPDVGVAWGTETVGDAIRTAALTHPGRRPRRRAFSGTPGSRLDRRRARRLPRRPGRPRLARSWTTSRRALAISHGADAYVVNDDGGERLSDELHARALAPGRVERDRGGRWRRP